MGKKSILVQAVKEANLNAVKALLQKDHPCVVTLRFSMHY